MAGYSSIRKIKVIDDPDEVNRLLKKWWELLEICKGESGILFVLGSYSYNPIDEFRDNYAHERTSEL